MTKPILPALPRAVAVPWSPRTRNVWKAWQQDFATGAYGPSEIAMAVELAFMFEMAVRHDQASRWSEIRQWMDRLALTPRGKRDLRLRLDESTDAADETASAEHLADYRDRLARIDNADSHFAGLALLADDATEGNN